MFFSYRGLVGGLLTSLAVSGPANAILVTFDDIPSSGTIFTSLSYQGVLFTSDHLHTFGRMEDDVLADNGTTWIGSESGRGGPITMSLLDGALFSLLSLDLSEFYDRPGDRPDAQLATLIGLTRGGTTIVQQLFLDGNRADGIGGIADFEHFVLPSSFTDLMSLTFVGSTLSGHDGGFALDNIEYAPVGVPEPTTLSLLGVGVLGALAARRRKTQGTLN